MLCQFSTCHYLFDGKMLMWQTAKKINLLSYQWNFFYFFILAIYHVSNFIKEITIVTKLTWYWKVKNQVNTIKRLTTKLKYGKRSVSLDCTENVFQRVCVLNSGSHALFTGVTSTEFNKIFIKIRSHNTIYTFKNYFVTVFSVFNNKRYPNRPKI